MRTNSFHKAWVCRRAGRVVLLLAVLFLFPSVSQADVVTVDCTGGTPGAFTSITAALNFLPTTSSTEPHTITVTGTCTENVNILNRQRITIEAPAGQTATITSAFPQQSLVVNIAGSRAITLRRLVIRDGYVGLWITRASEVVVQNSTMENNVTQGLRVLESSNVRLESSTITNNGAQGLRVDPNCYVMVGGNSPSLAVLISNNGGDGISADGAKISINGNTTVESNRSVAIRMTGGRLIVNGNQGENIFRNNGNGILLGSMSASFTGQNTIQNNAVTGVQLVAGNATFNQFVLPDGTFRVTTIEGHGTSGVTIANTSQLSLSGHHIIRNNGSAPVSSNWAGVRVFNNSMLSLGNGVEITGNTGPGILADLHASLLITNPVTITGNSEEGIRLTLLAGANFLVSTLLPSPSLPPNVISSITCDSSSVLAGDLTGIGTIDCKNIETGKKK